MCRPFRASLIAGPQTGGSHRRQDFWRASGPEDNMRGMTGTNVPGMRDEAITLRHNSRNPPAAPASAPRRPSWRCLDRPLAAVLHSFSWLW